MIRRRTRLQSFLFGVMVVAGLCMSRDCHAFFFENHTVVVDTPLTHVSTIEYSVSAVGGPGDPSQFRMNGSPNWFWIAARSDWDNDGLLDDVKVEAFHLVGPHFPEGPNVLHTIVYLFNTGAGGGSGGPEIDIVQHGRHRDKLSVIYASIGADRSLFTITLDHESLPIERQVIQNFDDQPDNAPPLGWTVGNQAGELGAWMVEAGELSIEGIGAGTVGNGAREVWIWYDRSFAGDITIEFNLKWLATPADGVGRHGGISFFSKFPGVPGSRYAGMNGYTLDWIDRPTDHGIRLHKWTNGAEVGLLPEGLFTDPDPPELWRLEIRGDMISIYLDDNLFQEVQDTTYRDGLIGFFQWENNIHVHYDNLTITNPDLVVNRDVPDDLVNGTSGTVKLTVLPYLAGTVVVKEDLPLGLTPSNASNGGAVNGQTVEWNLGDISDTTEVTYTLTASPTALDSDLGGSASHNGTPYPIAGDTTYTGSPVTTLGFVKLWNHLGPLAFKFPSVLGDDGPPGACDANGGVDLALDWIVNEDGSITEADILPFPGMVTRPAYGGDGLPGGTGARAAGLVVEAGPIGAVTRSRYPVWKGSLTRSDTIDHASATVHGFDAEDHLTLSCVYVTNNTGTQIDTQLGFGSDDSAQIFLNDVDLTTGGVATCRSWGANNEEQNTWPVSLPDGESRVLVKVSDGYGGSGFRLRFQDPDDPLAPGLLPPDLSFSLESARNPRPAATVTRSIAQASYELGGVVDVSLAAPAQPEAASMTVREVLPEFASAEGISDSGALSNGIVTWSISNASAKTLTYKLMPALCGAVSTYGQSTFAIGSNELLIDGVSSVPRTPFAEGDLASWESIDIGTTGGAAQALGEHDVVVDAGGAGIKLKEDQFRFIYVPLTGDVEMTAKIDCMSDSAVGGQVGIMIRDTTEVFSAHAFLALTTGDLAKTGLRALRGQFRRETNAARLGLAITIADGDVPSLPIWLRVRRAEGKVSFFRSSDGVDFGLPIAEKEIGTTTQQLNLSDDVLLGLAATGGGGRVSATIRDVTGPSFKESPQPKFHRGDSDNNGQLQLTDAVRILGYLFLGQVPLTCFDAADTNDDGKLDISDAVMILAYLFLGGAPPTPPGPLPNECGPDPTEDLLDCASYPPCGGDGDCKNQSIKKNSSYTTKVCSEYDLQLPEHSKEAKKLALSQLASDLCAKNSWNNKPCKVSMAIPSADLDIAVSCVLSGKLCPDGRPEWICTVTVNQGSVECECACQR